MHTETRQVGHRALDCSQETHSHTGTFSACFQNSFLSGLAPLSWDSLGILAFRAPLLSSQGSQKTSSTNHGQLEAVKSDSSRENLGGGSEPISKGTKAHKMFVDTTVFLRALLL